MPNKEWKCLAENDIYIDNLSEKTHSKQTKLKIKQIFRFDAKRDEQSKVEQ